MTTKEQKRVIALLTKITEIASNTTDAAGLKSLTQQMIDEYRKPTRYPVCPSCQQILVDWYSHSKDCDAA